MVQRQLLCFLYENGYGQEKDAERETGRKEKGEEGSAEANTAEGGKKERKGIGKN